MSSLARPFLRLAILTVLSWTAVAAADAPARGFADPLLGRWNLTIDGPDGRYPSWLEIRLRTESQLMAEFVGRFGSKRHAAAVSYAGGQLELRVPVQYEQGGEALVFTGVLADGRLSGQLRSGAGERFAWFGVRAPPLYRAGTVGPPAGADRRRPGRLVAARRAPPRLLAGRGRRAARDAAVRRSAQRGAL